MHFWLHTHMFAFAFVCFRERVQKQKASKRDQKIEVEEGGEIRSQRILLTHEKR